MTEARDAWPKIVFSNLPSVAEIFLFVPVSKKHVWKVLTGLVVLRIGTS
jgi:hypothetical protein